MLQSWGKCCTIAGMAKPPIVQAATKDPRFRAMMAGVKARDTWTGKLLAAGADHCYQGGEYTQPSRLVQLRRVATRLVLEDLTDGLSNAGDVVCVLLGSLSGLVERSGPGLRKASRVQAICHTDLTVQAALAAVATRDPAAAAVMAGWVVSAVDSREDDARAWVKERAIKHVKEGLAAPAFNLAEMLAPLKWPAIILGGGYLASKLRRR